MVKRNDNFLHLESMFDKVYKKNVFSDKDKKKIFSYVEDFMEELRCELKKHKVDAKVFLGGSSAKGTFLKGEFDCDIFIRFNYKKYSAFNDELSDIFESVLNNVTDIKHVRVHGSRDYFQFTPKGTGYNMTYEMIPVLEIIDHKKALNVTDVSPLHVVWLKKKYAGHHNKVRDAVLTKLFLKHCRLYGAESFIRGISGHDVDILINYYGSFLNIIESAISWQEGTVIDVEKFYPNENVALRKMNNSKIGPLVLVDPVQPERNAAASLSKEKFDSFKAMCLKFLENPSDKFFVKPNLTIESVKAKRCMNCKRFILDVDVLKGKTDIVGSKVLKIFEYLSRRLKRADFEILRKDWYWDKKKNCFMWFDISDDSISLVKENPFVLHRGPPLKRENDVDKFKEKYKETFIEGTKICTKLKRDFMTPLSLLRESTRQDYVKERCAKIKFVK